MSTNTEVDPLGNYDYANFGEIHQNLDPYTYHVKTEPHMLENVKEENNQDNTIEPKVENEHKETANELDVKKDTRRSADQNVNEVIDMDKINDIVKNIKQEVIDTEINLNQIPQKRKPRKLKPNGEKSTYMSKKITDTAYPFYGCAVCNISYTSLQELDVHVATHKNRLTSYDLRIKNQIKRRKLRKEQKKLKKLAPLVKQELNDDVPEIKPEDGYIGMEKASDFENHCNSINNWMLNNTLDKQRDTNSENKGDAIKNSHSVIENIVNNNDIAKNSVADDKNVSKGNCSNDKNINSCEGKVKKGVNSVKKPFDLKKFIGNEEELNNLQKIYKCFACNKQFLLSYYLKLHVRSHTDEKPYTCKDCGQSFITASKLGRHNKRIHLAIKYQCRICYKIFTRFEYLTKHFDKKHEEDKLEGEPYDYNAILPYLKELEEQLREKNEAKVHEKQKSENLWNNHYPTLNENPTPELKESIPPVPEHKTEDTKDSDTEHKDDTDQSYMPEGHLDILIEEIKVPVEALSKVDVKIEPLKSESTGDVFDNEDLKNEGTSDEDYFPSNTWASTPKIESAPPSPTPKQKRQKTDVSLQCKVCNKTINSVSYMRVHMRTHTGEKPFKCYICNRGFITSSKMHRHVLTHSESWKDEKEIKFEDVNVKLETEENGDQTINDSSLKKAKRKFSKKKKKSEPGRKKYQKRPHACEFCQKKFLHAETLNVHRQQHAGETASPRCSYCLLPQADAAALAEHETQHQGPKPYLCTICGRTYKRRETMVYHRKHHKPEKTYICDICSKSFNAPCKLQRHIVSHRVDKFVLRYECPVCAHMFNTKYHVQMHLATHQKEGLISEENRNDILAMVLQNARKIPKCPDAPANLTELIPADERSRVCNICGEVFQHFYYLEEHLKSHGSKIAVEDLEKVEEKKHTCQVCNKSFKLHYYLKLHSFTHTKEKPYICQQCGKGFITKGKLKRHLETHMGLKKYQCHICYKFFTRPSYLRIHVRTIHGTQDYNFRIGKEYGISPISALSFLSDQSG